MMCHLAAQLVRRRREFDKSNKNVGEGRTVLVPCWSSVCDKCRKIAMAGVHPADQRMHHAAVLTSMTFCIIARNSEEKAVGWALMGRNTHGGGQCGGVYSTTHWHRCALHVSSVNVI